MGPDEEPFVLFKVLLQKRFVLAIHFREFPKAAGGESGFLLLVLTREDEQGEGVVGCGFGLGGLRGQQGKRALVLLLLRLGWSL